MEWRLVVDGDNITKRLELSLEDLGKNYEEVTEVVTIECAGNGRIGMVPNVSGTLWRYGAVGTATFTGTPLINLLDETELDSGTTELLFVGADSGEVR